MRPTNKIASTHEEEMNLILDFVSNFDVHKLLYAINGKHLREDDIESLTLDIQAYLNRLKRQSTYLFRFGKTFNKEFALENNKCFDTQLKLSRRIKSGLAGVKKKVFRRFVKVTRRRLPEGAPAPTIHSRSLITTEHYSLDMYGMPSYPGSVRQLFLVMLEFYDVLGDCLRECRRVLDEERDLKADERACLQRFVAACEKYRRQQTHLIVAMENDPNLRAAVMNSEELLGEEKNPVLARYRKSRNMGKFAAEYFHNCSPSDVRKISLSKAVEGAADDPLRMLARTVFGNDDEHIDRINYVIAHFDSILPAACKRSQVPAYHLYVFMKWIKPAVGAASFRNYFNKYYKSHGGKWKTLDSDSALRSAVNRPHESKEKAEKCANTEQEMTRGIENLMSEFDRLHPSEQPDSNLLNSLSA